MSDTLPSLRLAISRFLGGEVSLRDLEAFVVPLGEQLPGENEQLNGVWGFLELLLAEHGAGHLDDDEIRAELLKISPVRIVVGDAPTAYHLTDATTAVVREPEPIRVRAAWLRNLRVVGTPTETAPALSAGHPA